MTTGSPAKHILNFAVPLILTNVGQQFYMIADAAIVGRGVGVRAFAAVGAWFTARVFMSQIAINWIGADALFSAEPASWLGAMLCVFLPYFYYRKKYLECCP